MIQQKRQHGKPSGENNTVTNVLFVGVGGQGTLVASKIMVEALLKAGFDVKKSEIHGMAQRGGSVISQVRFGPVVYSPLIRYGEGDIMVSFEQLEALRYLDYLHRDSLIFLNDQKILPPSVSMGIEVYPENIFTTLKSRFKNTFLIEGLQVAQNAGNARVLNIVLLGVLSRHLALDEKTWIETLREKLPPSLIDVNVRGFLLGREYEPAAVS